VEGFAFIIAQKTDKEEIPRHISIIIDVFCNVNIGLCDPAVALEMMKIIFAVGKTLYTTSPQKLDTKAWAERDGRRMVEWVRQTSAVFARRFIGDFEIMEVSLKFNILKADHQRHD